MKIEFGNIYYFIPIIICIVFIAFVFYLLKNKDEKIKKVVLLCILLFNFALHFLKQLAPGYREIPFKEILHKSTLENICAVSTVVFPFIFLFAKKNSRILDFMYFIGVLGGGLALIIPTEALDQPSIITFESIRFYICHIILISVPLLMVLLKLHKPRLSSVFIIPLFFLGYETIIFLNTLIFMKLGCYNFNSWSAFFDRDIANWSFVFGVSKGMDSVKTVFDYLTPKFLHTNYFNIPNIDEFYFPVLWLVLPIYVLFPPIYTIIIMPFIINKNKRKAK